jgi:hypothetical protein
MSKEVHNEADALSEVTFSNCSSYHHNSRYSYLVPFMSG